MKKTGVTYKAYATNWWMTIRMMDTSLAAFTGTTPYTLPANQVVEACADGDHLGDAGGAERDNSDQHHKVGVNVATATARGTAMAIATSTGTAMHEARSGKLQPCCRSVPILSSTNSAEGTWPAALLAESSLTTGSIGFAKDRSSLYDMALLPAQSSQAKL
ncbi:MAG: hypothetical protein FRX49_08265 [Trebouxia sp. A1-2]|nr:MAG: hypothetical protein FRX49_08265 [Trebouxia sp. A1-2]